MYIYVYVYIVDRQIDTSTAICLFIYISIYIYTRACARARASFAASRRPWLMRTCAALVSGRERLRLLVPTQAAIPEGTHGRAALLRAIYQQLHSTCFWTVGSVVDLQLGNWQGTC